MLLVLIITIISGCSDAYRYPPGKDTVEIYGDGTYQILSGPTSNTLANIETQEDIELVVYKYKEESPLVYVIGESGYTILNYQTGKIKKYKKRMKYQLSKGKTL
jgi:hypothetical protein